LGACTGGGSITCAAPDQCHQAGTCDPAAAPTPPQSGLVGWWRLDGDTHDAGPNHLDLENVGAQPTGGKVGRGYDFDGSSYLRLTNAPASLDMSHASGVTMMAWVRTSALAQPNIDYSAIMGKGYDYSMAVGWHTGAPSPGLTGTVHAQGYFGLGYPGWAGGLPAGTWSHVAIVWDKATNLLTNYINGFGFYQIAVPGFADTMALSNDTHTFAIGAFMQGDGALPSGFSPNYLGSIDEVVLYNRALSPGELNSYLEAANNPCTYPAKADGASCDDANACTQTDTCQSGVCTGSNPVVCTPSDQCHDAGTCSPQTGCSNPAKADGTSCSDGNLCTQADACQAGVCTGTSTVVCPTPDACHERATCDPSTGACAAPPAVADGTACSDSNSCTTGETCHAGACTSGTTITCGPPGQCQLTQAGTCDPSAGVAPPANGLIGWWRLEGDGVDSSASHDNLTVTSALSVGGQVGGALAFTPGTSCVSGAAPAGASLSGAPGLTLMAWVRVSNDWKCPEDIQASVIFGKGNDYNLAVKCWPTNGEPALFPLISQQGGGLGWGDPRGSLFTRGEWHHVAVTWDRANVLAFVDGVVTLSWPAPADINDIDHAVSIGCDDSNTYWVGKPFDGAVDEAVMYNRPLTPSEIADYYQASASPGHCSYTPKPNGTSCDDADRCTTGDSCQAGACVGAPVTCTAIDQCHSVGACDPQTGACMNPAKGDFTGCDDGDACTRTDYCLLGVCTGQNHVDCSSGDACTAPGVCDRATGVCAAPQPRPDGASCSDGNACTDGDTCHAGSCVAGAPAVCAAAQCQTAACDPTFANLPPQDDLIGWWRLDGNTVDSGPNHIDLTGSEASVVGGKIGKALDFDGFGCYTVPAPPVSSTAGDDAMTVMAWVKVPADFPCPTQPNNDRVVFAHGQDYVISVGCNAAGEPTPGGSIHASGFGYGFGHGAVGVTPDVWHLVTVGFDHGAIYVLVDGQVTFYNDYGPSAHMTNESSMISLGCNQGQFYWVGQSFVGSVDEVTVYRHALSVAEVQAYYDATSTEHGRCGSPTPVADGASCDDGDQCTSGDTCHSGACGGGAPVTCKQLDQCHAIGTCSPSTGCSNPLLADGTSCNDGNVCTQTDTCQAGACTGANPVACTSGDLCQQSTCDPTVSSYPTDGLVALWHLDGNGKDSSDGGNDLTVNGVASIVPGDLGPAYSFDGTTTCLTEALSNSNDPHTGSGVTIAGWVNPSAACPGTWPILRRGDQIALQLSCAGAGAAGLSYALDTGAGLTFTPPVGSIPTGQWSFVAMTWDKAAPSKQVHLYVNGADVGGGFDQSGALSAAAASWTYLSVGCSTARFSGSLDEVAFYDRPLSADKIQTLAAPPSLCKATPKCADPDSCHTGSCDPGTGACLPPIARADGDPCDDGQRCTQGDVCTGGVCQGHSATVCPPASSACNESSCDPRYKPLSPADFVAEWHLDGNGTDSSGHGNDLTLGQPGQTVAGKVGQAMHFGVNDGCFYAPATPSNNINGPAGVTISAWVKPDVGFCTSGASGRIISRNNELGFRLACNPDGTIGVEAEAFAANGFGGIFNPHGVLKEGQWAYVAIEWVSGYAYNTFVDGDLVGGDGLTAGSQIDIAHAASWILVGCNAGATIDEASIVRRDLSMAEMGLIATSPSQCNDQPKACFAADSCHQNGTCDPASGACVYQNRADGSSCSDAGVCATGQICTAGVCGGGSPTCAQPAGQCQTATCDETVAPAPPADGLVGWWRFEGDTKDSSGHGLDLVNSGAQLTAGKVGQAFDFNGIDNCLTLAAAPPSVQLVTAPGLTMMAWIKAKPGPTPSLDFRSIISKGFDYSMVTLTEPGGSLVNLEGAIRLAGLYDYGYPSGVGISYIEEWALVALTWDHHNYTLWLNGVPSISYPKEGALNNWNTAFNIGCSELAGFPGLPGIGQPFLGAIDEAALYNRVLTTTEMQQYYNAVMHPTPSCAAVAAADGTACNDGNACTSGDTCHLGTCYGAAMMSCPQPGPCQILAGTCDPQTGCPAPIAAPDGTACNDNNACTQTDACHAGACVGANPVTCAVADECHGASTCDPQTGTCSKPTITGTSDVCLGGSFDYDGAGRLVRDHATTLTYDAYDQLRAVVPGPTSGGGLLTNLSVDDLGDIGTGTFSSAEDINGAGQVIVEATVSGGATHGFLTTGPGTFLDMSDKAAIPGSSYPISVSSAGDVLLNQQLGPPDAYALWKFRAPDVVEQLPPLPGGVGWGSYVNSTGEVVGYLGTFFGARTTFRYTDAGGYEDVGSFGGPETDPWALDDDGTIYMSSDYPDSPRVLSDTSHFGHAAVFDPTTHQLVDLNNLIDTTLSPGWTLYNAVGGDSSYYYGQGDLDGVHQPYRLKKATGEVQPIGLIGAGKSFSNHSNKSGDVAGWGYKDANNTQLAGWVYIDGRGLVDLNTVIDPASGWQIDAAYGINDQGDVIGWGTFNGHERAFRVRLPLRTAGAAGPALAEAHTYGYDGLRTSTSTGPDLLHLNQSQYFFTQNYTETTAGNREHYVRVGDRIVSKVTMKPGPAGSFVPAAPSAQTRRNPPGPGGSRPLGQVALLLSLGFFASIVSRAWRRRRWAPVVSGLLALSLTATACEMFGVRDKVAAALWHSDATGDDAPHYFHDGLAAGPTIITKTDGTVLEERRYDPFGQSIDARGAGGSTGSADYLHEPQNILGKLTDANTGWSYHGARWMAPQTARWQTPDPAIKGPDPKHLMVPWDLNPYAYGRQSPSVFWDPDGQVVNVLAAAGAAVGGAAVGAGFRLVCNLCYGVTPVYKGVGGAAAGGAVTAGMAALTMGGSLALQTTLLAGGLASLEGEYVSRAVNGEPGPTMSEALVTFTTGAMLNGIFTAYASRAPVPVNASYVNPIKLEPVNGAIDVGGCKNPAVSNLNNMTGGPVSLDTPNLVIGDFKNIATYFKEASASLIEGWKLSLGRAFPWSQAAEGSFAVLRPGGMVQMNVWLTRDEAAAVVQIYKDAGFINVSTSGEGTTTILNAQKPTQ
jgi:RHS repeat-associated protein